MVELKCRVKGRKYQKRKVKIEKLKSTIIIEGHKVSEAGEVDKRGERLLDSRRKR